MTSLLRIACVQMRSGVEQADNIATMRELVREAAAQGARYVQTPEMTGLVQRSRKALFSVISEDRDNPVFQAASDLAKEFGIWLHVGSTAVAISADKAVNRAGFFSPAGDRIAYYDKIHMFDVDLRHGESWRESSIYEAGGRALVLADAPANVGLAICYDLRFPDLFRQQAMAGAQLLTCPSCFTRQTGEMHWHVLLRARAIENGAFVAAAAQGGLHEDGRETFGHSLVVDPWGSIVAELDHDEPGVLVCDIDPSEVGKARASIPSLTSGSKFELQHIDGRQRRSSPDIAAEHA